MGAGRLEPTPPFVDADVSVAITPSIVPDGSTS